MKTTLAFFLVAASITASAHGELTNVTFHANRDWMLNNGPIPNDSAIVTFTVDDLVIPIGTVASTLEMPGYPPPLDIFATGPTDVPWWGLLENKVASLAGRSFTMTGTVDAGAYVATTTVTFPPPDLVMPTSLRLVMFGSYSSGYRYKPEVRGPSPEPGFVSLRGAYTIFFEVPEPGVLSLVVCAAGVVFGNHRRRATAYPLVQASPEF